MISEYSEVQLERIKLTFAQKMSNELLGAMVEVKSIADDFLKNQLTFVIQGYLWGESGKPQTIRYPATWWDAVKERWFPEWLVARYPVTYREYEINLNTLYPNFRISLPHETHVLKYEVYNRLTQ